MFDQIAVLDIAQSLARHAGQRQVVTARNMANADTPGYRARDLRPFSELVDAGPGTELRRTRPGHLSGGADGAAAPLRDDGGPAAPNGNTVSLEREMVRATDLRRQHDLALGVYSKSLDILRATLGRAR
ncbi:MAG: FlgB family protein [Tranquillimonas sp.]